MHATQHETTPETRISRIVNDVIEQRSRGVEVRDESVCESNPELMPALGEELRKLRSVERARQLSREYAKAESQFEELLEQTVRVEGYDIVREINRGGQAIVYLARQVLTGDLVAIKILSSTDAKREMQQGRFQNEVNALAAIRHRGVVPILQHGTTTDGEPYLAMPYIEGDDLNPAKLCQSMPLIQRIDLFLQICDAIAAAHDVGIIHRDLKPSNIRLDSGGGPHVLDFGLARPQTPEELKYSLTVTGQFLGTVFWCAPEQLRGEREITPAADVYSLGVILHQLVAEGQHPLHTFANLQSAAGTTAAPQPKTLQPEIIESAAKPLVPLIARCLSDNPGERPATARDLWQELRKVRRRVKHPSPFTLRRILIVVCVLLVALAGGEYYREKLQLQRYKAQLPRLNGRTVLRYEVGGLIAEDFVWIPAGEFLMGSPPTEVNRLIDEDQHRVRIARGFYLQTREVHQALFEKVMGFNPSRFKSPQNPVEKVNWFEAEIFCQKYGEMIGKKVRLPTEAEWEYACRAGSSAPFVTGYDEQSLVRYANLGDESCPAPLAGRAPYNDGAPYTREVGSGLANNWMLQNMHGNVWEWCQDEYKRYPTSPVTDQVPTTLPTETDAVRMNSRGGSWWDTPFSARAASRNPLDPHTREETLGFRVLIEE